MNFDHILLRLKQQLGSATDKEVAELLGLSKTAFAERKRRDAFPREKLMALAGERPDLHLNIAYILTGVMPSMDEQEKIQASITFTQSLPSEQRDRLMQKLQDGIIGNTRDAAIDKITSDLGVLEDKDLELVAQLVNRLKSA